jgi:sulfur carrier protein ThiS
MSIGPMKVTIRFVPQNTTKELILEKGSTVTDLLHLLHRRPDTVIVLKNKTPVPEDAIIADDSDLSVVQVASGG